MSRPAPREIVLGADRLPGALALSTEAGWNQVEADWRFMLANGEAFGMVDEADALVGSGLTLEFPDYAWISMILVTQAWRRRGLATRLMDRCIDRLAARGLVAALDASPQGREVYLKLGFRDIDTSTRFAGPAGGRPPAPSSCIGPLTTVDLPELADYDRRLSGTDRGALLAHLIGRCPQAALAARRDGRIAGYALARPGRLCHQIGPLFADDAATAASLLDAARFAIAGPVCLDVVDRHQDMKAALAGDRFAPVTRFVRMVLGNSDAVPVLPGVYVLGGPELS